MTPQAAGQRVWKMGEAYIDALTDLFLTLTGDLETRMDAISGAGHGRLPDRAGRGIRRAAGMAGHPRHAEPGGGRHQHAANSAHGRVPGDV